MSVRNEREEWNCLCAVEEDGTDSPKDQTDNAFEKPNYRHAILSGALFSALESTLSRRKEMAVSAVDSGR